MHPLCVVLVLPLLLWTLPDPAGAVSIDQLDDFQDGTTQGWTTGVPDPDPPSNVADGGPAGTGDAYLQVTSDGFGPGSRLVAFNRVQWAGDYLSAGVDGIAVSVNNLGTTDLILRLALDGAGGRFAGADGIAVSPGSGWQEVTFSLDPADLVFVGSVGTGDVNATLGSASELRLLHAPTPAFNQAPAITAILGIDNVMAVPEANSAVLLGWGLLGLAWLRRPRRYSSAGS